MRFVSLSIAAVLVSMSLQAAELPIERLIDEQIQAKWKEDKITPAAQIRDENFIRRVTLDTLGRIPTASEVAGYVESKDANKRAALVDRLLGSSAYNRYQAYLFEAMLNDRASSGGRGNSGALKDYLTIALAENRPWDKMYREMMIPDESDPKLKGVSDFLKPKLTDADRLTNDVSVAFFGVNVSCAQCHDHPLVKDWTQDHFYGMKGFLARTFDAGGFIAERNAGLIKYKPTKGPERTAKLMFLTGEVVESETVREMSKEDLKKDKDVTDAAKNAKKAPPAPEFSARARLVDISLKNHESNFFAKSIVNRLWHRFFGSGLVNPLDQMHSENAPSHPELLNKLAKDMQANGYNMRRLVRGILMSQTYSTSSKYDSESQPNAQTFAVARLKALTPWQMATSLKIAASDPKVFEGLSPADLEKKLDAIEASARGMMNHFAWPGENFQIGVSEALFFSNSDRIGKEIFIEGKDTLLTRTSSDADVAKAIGTILTTMLNRPATPDEIKAMTAFLAARNDRKMEAYRQLLWAVGTSPEFRFNH